MHKNLLPFEGGRCSNALRKSNQHALFRAGVLLNCIHSGLRIWKPIILAWLWCITWCLAPGAQAQKAPANPDLLTVDDAVKIALANNRSLKIVSLSVDSSKFKVQAAKTKRLPAFDSYVFGAQTLTPFSFTIPAGQFGTYPGIGPIPATDSHIKTGATPTAYVFATASQPLLSLYKVNLRVEGEKLSMEQSVQDMREKRISVVNDVRQAYYSVVEIENVIAATNASIKQYQELDRITLQYVSQQVALQSDSLEVKAKLADTQLKLLQANDKLQTAKETLNNLLGRDLNIDFLVDEDKQLTPIEQDLKAAQSVALDQNPKLKQAALKIQQADNVRRLAKAEYIPDMSLSFHYISPFGVDFLPSNVASVGLEFKWEPFDWGRRKDVVSEKTLAVEQSKLNLDDVRSNVLIEVNKQFRSLQEARMAVDVAATAQEASRMKLREVTLQYQQKNALLRDVFKQEASVESANSDYNEAIASYWTAKANFEKALGAD